MPPLPRVRNRAMRGFEGRLPALGGARSAVMSPHQGGLFEKVQRRTALVASERSRAHFCKTLRNTFVNTFVEVMHRAFFLLYPISYEWFRSPKVRKNA